MLELLCAHDLIDINYCTFTNSTYIFNLLFWIQIAI